MAKMKLSIVKMKEIYIILQLCFNSQPDQINPSFELTDRDAIFHDFETTRPKSQSDPTMNPTSDRLNEVKQ